MGNCLAETVLGVRHSPVRVYWPAADHAYLRLFEHGGIPNMGGALCAGRDQGLGRRGRRWRRGCGRRGAGMGWGEEGEGVGEREGFIWRGILKCIYFRIKRSAPVTRPSSSRPDLTPDLPSAPFHANKASPITHVPAQGT